MQSKALFVVAALLFAALGNGWQPVVAGAEEEGFQAIFNGRDLSEWEGEPGYWSIENGAIMGRTTDDKSLKDPTYLFWRGGQPTDFELRVTFRFEGDAGNSGINFRSQQLPKWDVKGYQADLDAGSTFSGILYECNGRAMMSERGQDVVIDENGQRHVTTLAESPTRFKPTEWNEYAVIARGPEIVLRINGTVTSHVVDREKDKAARSGSITLQLHPGPPMKVQFKNLRIKNL